MPGVDAVMTESEYINATNLTRVRLVLNALHEMSPDTLVPEAEHRLVSEILGRWQRDLESVVQTEPDCP